MSRQEGAHGALQCRLDSRTEPDIENLIQQLAKPRISRGTESKYAMIALIVNRVVQRCGKAEKRNHEVELACVWFGPRDWLFEAAVAGSKRSAEEEGVDEKSENRALKWNYDTGSLRLHLIGSKPEIVGSKNAGRREALEIRSGSKAGCC